ncbi:MAG: hypothetical protein IPN94_08845 [Sphingobacteriales bacterium]|nr:hypothetical protein [Sphingobacteriales bacterium]
MLYFCKITNSVIPTFTLSLLHSFTIPFNSSPFTLHPPPFMNHFTLLVAVLLYGTLTAQAQETETEHPYYASFTQPYKTIVKTSKGYVEVEYFPPMGRDVSWQMLISPATQKLTKCNSKYCSHSWEPEKCKLWCVSEISPQYKTITRQILTQPLTWTETPLWLPEIERVLEPFDFTISPNPAETQLHLDTDRNYQAAKLYITNIRGRGLRTNRSTKRKRVLDRCNTSARGLLRRLVYRCTTTHNERHQQ